MPQSTGPSGETRSRLELNLFVVKNKITAILFAASLLWGIWVYGATETQNTYRLFLLCLIPTLLAVWKLPSTPRFILLASVGFVLTLNVALRHTLQAEGYLVAAVGWMALFIATRLSGQSNRWMRRFMLLIILIGGAEALYAFFQYFSGRQEHATGTLVNRNHFAGLVNIAIAMAAGATFAGFSRRVRAGVAGSEVRAWSWLTGLACALMGLAVVLSGSRGGVVTLASTLLFLCALLALKHRSYSRSSLSPRYAWILLVAIFGFAAWAGAEALGMRFAKTEEGLANRAAIAGASVRLVADRPLFGIGPGMYKWRFRPYQPEPVTNWYDHAHNDYLEVAAEWGVPLALAFWAVVVWSFLVSARVFLLERRDSWLQGIALGCTCAIFGILLHSLVDFNLQIPATLMVFGVVLGISFELLNHRDTENTEKSRGLRVLCVSVVQKLIHGARVFLGVLLAITCLWSGVLVLNRLVALQLFLSNQSLEGATQAINWDPRVPEFYFHLGLIKRDIPEHLNVEESIRNLERAVALNPYRWDYLNELGRAYEVAGREAEAARVYKESVRLNPRSGLYRWRLANYYLRTKGLAGALPSFREAVKLDPSYMAGAARLLSGAGATAEQLIRICSEDSHSRLTLLKMLEAESAAQRQSIDFLWSEILAGTPPPTLSDGLFHLDYLLRDGNLDRVRENWINLCRNSRLKDEAFETGINLVWNGGFELPIFGKGLDWQLQQEDGYSVRLAKGEGVRGSTAFRIDFDGKANPDVAILRQTVLVASGEHYELKYRARSEALTSDQGVHVQVIDAQSSHPVAESARILGTTAWQDLVLRIPGLPNGSDANRKLCVVVRRDKSWKIDNRAGGTLWLDDVVIH